MGIGQRRTLSTGCKRGSLSPSFIIGKNTPTIWIVCQIIDMAPCAMSQLTLARHGGQSLDLDMMSVHRHQVFRMAGKFAAELVDKMDENYLSKASVQLEIFGR